MPIEIRCPKCQKLLRVPDTAAGKRARCPDCQEIVPIPGEASSSPPASAFPPESSANPFGEAAAPSPPADAFKPAADPTNPYAASAFYEDAPKTAGGLRREQVTFNELFEGTLHIFKVHAGPLIIVGVLAFAVHAVTMMVSYAISIGSAIVAGATGMDWISVVGSLVDNLFQFLVYPLPMLGALLSCRKLLREGATKPGDFFEFGRSYGVSLLANLLVGIGLVVILAILVVPAIALMVSQQTEVVMIIAIIYVVLVSSVVGYGSYLLFYLSYCFIIDRQAGPIESLTLSMNYMRGNYLAIIGTTLLLFIIALPLTLCTCGFILIVISPIYSLINMLAYYVVTGQRSAISAAAWGPLGAPPSWR